jgi:hypothetical protein
MRVVALVAAGTIAAGCGSGVAIMASSSPRDGAPAPYGCLSPRTQASTPAGGWLPGSIEPVSYDPHGPGATRAPAAQARALGSRFAHDLAAARFKLANFEYATPGCVTGWDAALDYSDGAYADERVMQLARPMSLYSFAFVSSVSAFTEDGVRIYQAVTPDGSSVTDVAVRPDGLLIYVQVRSATGLDMWGYPTTTAPSPSTAPPQPSPAPPERVTSAALDLLATVAGT